MSQNGPDQDPWGKPGQSSGPKQSDNSSDKQNENGWGARDNKNQEQSPPDIEEVFNNLLKKLGGGNKKSGSNNTSPNMPSFNLGKILPIAAVIGGIIWGASGFYTIKEAERGVTLRFGEFHSIVQPGLNWKPTFIDKVIPVNVEQVRELKTQGAMLTKDENMVKVEMTVQYRVQNPEKYLFSVSNADNSLGQATDSALRYVIGHMTMNDVLTTGRAVVREDTWNNVTFVKQKLMLARKSQSLVVMLSVSLKKQRLIKIVLCLMRKGKWNVYNVFYLNLKRHLIC